MASARPSFVRGIPPGPVVLYAAIYVIVAALSLSTAYVQANAAAVWIPSGFSVGLLIVHGPRYWPAVAAGSFITNLGVNTWGHADVSMLAATAVAFCVASGNVGEALLGAYLTKRFASGYGFLSRTRSFAAFALLAVPLPALVSMAVGVGASRAGGFAAAYPVPEVMLTWYIANAVGILIFASATCLVLTQPLPRLAPWKALEASLLAACLAVLSQALCGFYLSDALSGWPRSYMVVPFLLWAAFRFGAYGALTSIVPLTAISVTGTMQGFMAFPAEAPSRSLIYLQIYLAMLAAMTISISAALCEVGTLRASLEAKVRTRTKSIEDLLRERDAFTVIVAHDLQSPLYGVRNALRAAVDAIKGGRMSASEIIAALQTMDETCSTLAERVAGLLTCKGSDAVPPSGERRAPLSTVLERIVAAHRIRLERKALNVSLAGDMKIEVACPKEIEHILDILIDNAIKYSPTGASIEVAAYRHGSSIEMLVSDRGKGIAPSATRALFHPSFSGPEAAETSGHGLGLYLASEQAANLGGRLTYSEVQPTGARFRLVVPAVRANATTGSIF